MWKNIRKGIILAIAFTILSWAWKQLSKDNQANELFDKLKNLIDA